MRFHLKLTKYEKTIKVSTSHNSSRFIQKLAMARWENGPILAYLRVSYGVTFSFRGNSFEGYNDGYFSDKESLLYAFKLFKEVSYDL